MSYPTKAGYHVQHLSDSVLALLARARPRVVVWLEWTAAGFALVHSWGGVNIVRVVRDDSPPGPAWLSGQLLALHAQFGSAIDFYLLWNEPSCNPEPNGATTAIDQLNADSLAVIAATRLPILVGGLSQGNPKNLPDFARLAPAIRESLKYGGGIATHEYDAPRIGASNGYRTLRYRLLWAQLPADVQGAPWFIPEWGLDGGIVGQNLASFPQFGNDADHLWQLQGYDAQVCLDSGQRDAVGKVLRPNLRGFAQYDLGAYPPWGNFELLGDTAIADYIAGGTAVPVANYSQIIPNSIPPARIPVQDFQSPNHDGARAATLGVVIHSTRGGASSLQAEYDATVNWFANPQSQVSAHAVAGPGRQITRPVRPELIAWHARSYNAGWLGIELVQPRHGDPIEADVFDLGARTVADWHLEFGFPLVWNIQSGLAEHWEIPPGIADGKTDVQAPFDRAAFLALVTYYAQGADVLTADQKLKVLDHLSTIWGFADATQIARNPTESQNAIRERVIALKDVLRLNS